MSVCLGRGGAERVTSILATRLDRRRFAPELCLLRGPVDYPVPDDVPITILDKNRSRHIPRTIARVRRTIAASAPDVIVGNTIVANWMIGAALRNTAFPPFWVARFAAPPALERWQERILAGPILGSVFRGVGRWVANSHALAKDVAEYFGLDPGCVSTVVNPVDVERIDAQAARPAAIERNGNDPVLIAVGRLARQKRIDVLLQALALVRGNRPARLWVCGDGPERASLRSLAAELGLERAVTWMGFCENPYALMKQADLFTLSSDFEGLPNALIEAQALGLPAVATRCPTGPEEIVDDRRTGLLVPPGDPEAFATAITGLLSRPAELAVMGNTARDLARSRFGCSVVVPQWEALLDRGSTSEVC